jgi:hypothetical protein
MATPALNNVTVIPKTDGTLDVTANVTPGAITIPTVSTFNLTALLKLIEDLTTDVPVIIADVQAVFGTTTTPTPAPTPTPTPMVPPPRFGK